MKNLYLLLISLFLPTIISAQVVVNEYSAANYDDNDFQMGPGQEYEDWIELYNNGAASVDLSGFHLSDRLNNIMKWQFPAGTTINANDRLLIVASGLDDNSYGEINTNFKLTQTRGNEYVILSDATGVILDSIRLDYPNRMNHSRGRLTDGGTTWGIFENPTVDAANTGGTNAYMDMPTFGMAPGFYPAAINVTLSNTSGAPIRYTTDGSEPDVTSTLYSGPINVTSTTVIKALTISSGATMSNSHVNFNTYFINENHTVRVMSIAGDDITTLLNGNQIEPIGSFELFDTDGTFLAEGTGDFNEHGNDSWAYDQRGLDWVTRDQLGNTHAIEEEIFPTKSRDEYQRLILKAAASDNYPFENGGAHIRDAYVHMMSQLGDLRMDERTSVSAVMYVNGNYWGVYEIREKVDDNDFTDIYYDQNVPDIQFLKTWGGTWQEYGAPGALADWNTLRNYITSNNMAVQANYDFVKGQFNTGSIIDYFILNSYIVNADWLNWNTAWWRGLNPNGDKKKWRYTLWDMDASFDHYINFTGVPSQSPLADPCDPQQLGNPGSQGHVPIWNALLDNDEFFGDYINRYAELSSSVFSCDSMIDLFNNMVNDIQPEMPRHITRWGGSMTTWNANVQAVRDFINTRCTFIAGGIVDCYQPTISGPYEVMVVVDPPLSGEVQLHTITPSTYPFFATYFGGVDIDLEAQPFTGFIFDHWELSNGTLLPNTTLDTVTMQLNADDTLIAYFLPDTLDYDTLIIAVEPPGAGTVTIDGTNISAFAHTEYIIDGSAVTFDAIANAGYSFNNWEMTNNTPLPNNTSANIVITVGANDSITVHFDVIPLDTVTFIVNPVGAGTLNIGATNYAAFPTTEIFNSGTSSNLMAVPNAGFNFDNWSMTNNTPTPNNTSATVSVTWADNDTVYLNFSPIPVDTIVLLVDPVGAGSIDFNGTNLAAFPSTQIINQGSNATIQANNNPNFTFDFWESNASTILPNTTSAGANFTAVANDTIIAHFDEFVTDTLIVMMYPNGAGSLQVETDVITTTPFMGVYEVGSVLNIEATVNGSNTWSRWELNTSTLPDYNAQTFFTFINQDTLFAFFNAPVAIEDLGDDFEAMSIYPTVFDNLITVEYTLAEAAELTVGLYDINGKLVEDLGQIQSEKGVEHQEQFEVNVPAGMYLIKLQTEKSFITHKLIKVK